jgi:hypothetical protein
MILLPRAAFHIGGLRKLPAWGNIVSQIKCLSGAEG